MPISLDDAWGLVHSVNGAAANMSDIVAADKLLHGKEEPVWAAAFIGN